MLVTWMFHDLEKMNVPDWLQKFENFLTQELGESKQTIIDKLGVTPEVLVIPYGDTDNRVLKACKKYYSIFMRVGRGFNLSWTNIDGYCYRLDADKYLVHGKTMPTMHKLRFWQQFFTKSVKSLLRRN